MKAFYRGQVVWSRDTGNFSIDFKDLQGEEDWGWIYNKEKGCVII